MSLLSRSLSRALDADASLWPGSLGADASFRLEAALSGLPEDVSEAVLAGLVDPERNDWARGAVLGLALASTAGASATGLVSDELLEMQDGHGERFGLSPLGFRVPRHRQGDPGDVRRLMASLDNTFAERSFVVYLRRPVPRDVDVGPIQRAVHLWLSAIDRGDRDERHAVYEDGDVAIDLTLVDSALSGRVLTIGPVTTLERLGAVDARVVDTLLRHEESVGSLPIVVVASADRPWGLSRGYVQQLLYGTPEHIACRHGPDEYQAVFNPNGRSLFSDPACRALSAVWWLQPHATDPDLLAFDARVHDNPWAVQAPELVTAAPRFRRIELMADRRARLTWELP